MAKIVWSKLAMKDIDIIHDFIAKESLFYAQQTIEHFFNRVMALNKFPELGRQVPEYMRKDIRELIEGNYRIFYKLGSNNISIIRVHHASRKIRRGRSISMS